MRTVFGLLIMLAFVFSGCGSSELDKDQLKKENAELKLALEKCQQKLQTYTRSRDVFDHRSRRLAKGNDQGIERGPRPEDSGTDVAGQGSKHVSWYPNGQVKEEVEMNQNDDRQGMYVSFYENGQKKEEGQYRNNKKHGKWMKWDKDGNVIEETEWVDGVKQ